MKRASGWLGATKITGTVNVRYVRQGGPLWCAVLAVLAGCFYWVLVGAGGCFLAGAFLLCCLLIGLSLDVPRWIVETPADRSRGGCACLPLILCVGAG